MHGLYVNVRVCCTCRTRSGKACSKMQQYELGRELLVDALHLRDRFGVFVL